MPQPSSSGKRRRYTWHGVNLSVEQTRSFARERYQELGDPNAIVLVRSYQVKSATAITVVLSEKREVMSCARECVLGAA